jgi:hypothetical protein
MTISFEKSLFFAKIGFLGGNRGGKQITGVR